MVKLEEHNTQTVRLDVAQVSTQLHQELKASLLAKQVRHIWGTITTAGSVPTVSVTVLTQSFDSFTGCGVTLDEALTATERNMANADKIAQLHREIDLLRNGKDVA